MTGILLLGLIEAADTVAPPRHAPHRTIMCPGPDGAPWTCLALEVDLQDGADDAERMLYWAEQQHQILAQYAEHHDVLPVALGSVFSNEAALSDHVSKESGALKRVFDRVAGRSEYILKIIAETPKPRAGNQQETGAAFLQMRREARDARRQLQARRQSFVQALIDELCNRSDRHVRRQPAGQSILADISVLLTRDAAPEMIRALEQRDRDSTALGLVLRLIGPVPAYSFLTEEVEHA